MTVKQLKKFLIQKSKKLNEEEKAYLQEEIKSINLGYPEWNKIADMYESGEKCENPHNILSLYLLGVSNYPKELKHHWELADVADIDLDFSPSGRDRLKDYLASKYGEENCLSIGTYGTLGVKGSVQEVSRVYDIKPQEYLKVSKLISDEDKDLDEDEIRSKYPQVDEFLKKHPEVADTMVKLTGMKKNIGCIASDQKLSTGIKISELDKHPASSVEFLGKDFNVRSNRGAELIHSGRKKCIELTFDDGSKLTCTHSHLIYTKNRGYVKANNLNENDEIYCVKM